MLNVYVLIFCCYFKVFYSQAFLGQCTFDFKLKQRKVKTNKFFIKLRIFTFLLKNNRFDEMQLKVNYIKSKNLPIQKKKKFIYVYLHMYVCMYTNTSLKYLTKAQ